MKPADIDTEFPRGLLRPELFLGVAASITARAVGVNLSEAGRPSGSHFSGGRYGRGEVGEFVLIEGQQSLILGRISEIKVREPERRGITRDFAGNSRCRCLPQAGRSNLRCTTSFYRLASAAHGGKRRGSSQRQPGTGHD